jgi:hypothetical protein
MNKMDRVVKIGGKTIDLSRVIMVQSSYCGMNKYGINVWIAPTKWYHLWSPRAIGIFCEAGFYNGSLTQGKAQEIYTILHNGAVEHSLFEPYVTERNNREEKGMG